MIWGYHYFWKHPYLFLTNKKLHSSGQKKNRLKPLNWITASLPESCSDSPRYFFQTGPRSSTSSNSIPSFPPKKNFQHTQKKNKSTSFSKLTKTQGCESGLLSPSKNSLLYTQLNACVVSLGQVFFSGLYLVFLNRNTFSGRKKHRSPNKKVGFR